MISMVRVFELSFFFVVVLLISVASPSRILNETVLNLRTPGSETNTSTFNSSEYATNTSTFNSSEYATGFKIKKWHNFKLGYLLTRDHFPEAAMFGIELAFEEWSANSNFIFYNSQGFYDYELTLGFYRRNHGDGSPFDGKYGILAHAFLPPVGHLHFDADENWCFDNTKGVPPDALDFETVALHEIGHLLGMEHSEDPSAVMYGTLDYGMFKTLTRDDIDGLAYIYGPKTNF